jgi:hypothetical protein
MALIKCSDCENQVSDKASFCPKCGAPIKHSKIEEVRAGVNQANLNEDLSGPFFFQILVIAIAIGYYNKSWYIFAGTFLGLLILFAIPYVRRIISLALAGPFGLFGYLIGNDFWGQEAGYVIGGFFFLSSLAISFGGIDYMSDISKD